jgi:hypothetical protein
MASEATRKEKECPRCDVRKPIDAFCLNRSRSDGRAAYCRLCQSTANRVWRATRGDKNASKRYRSALLRRFQITQEDYDERAKGGCEACGETEDLCLDHDHETGAFRGILCRRCNASIGLAGDSLERLKKLVAYLEQDVLSRGSATETAKGPTPVSLECAARDEA